MEEKNKEAMTFEAALSELETIVKQLEQNDVPLEQALDQYQRGIKLAKLCREKLEKAEETLIKVVDETGQERPFTMEQDEEGEK